MDLQSWYKKRGPQFIWQRGILLLDRYSIGSTKATNRITDCVETLGKLGCAPTFFTPGFVMRRNPKFFQFLQQIGVEIAVHSFHHINLGQLPISVAEQQLARAIQTFELFGVENRGFRCPYLDYSDDLLDSLSSSMFDYSSNEALLWDVVEQNDLCRRGLFFTALEQFYKAKKSSENICLPFMRSNLIEIPICVPDDLQLHDGLELCSEDLTQVWIRFLEQTYNRGELFTLIFHTELASFYDNPFIELVKHARQCKPYVWIARLRDISDWWREKSKFEVKIITTSTGLQLSFLSTHRATILVRGLDIGETSEPWCGSYNLLKSPTLQVPAFPRPFIGLASDVPESTAKFLREQGYILDVGETSNQCGIYLDKQTLSKLENDVQLTNYIETFPSPLVRYWHWPNGAKSAMSITGDLDALSLMDYASRLFV